MSTSSQRDPRFSGYNLFTEEFFKQYKERHKGKGKGKGKGRANLRGGLREEMTEAWKKLTSNQKAEYTKRAKQLRAPVKLKKYVVPFQTRCALKTFKEVCNNLKGRPEAMRRLKQIGFDRLVSISCRQINRSLCAQFMTCFDPPTKEVCIRGETQVIGAEHVHQLMGLPVGGKAIKVNLNGQHQTFSDYRKVYKDVPYKKVAEMLGDKLDQNFEFLFVLFALGTLLAPSASILVSDRLLKVMMVTKNAIADFDWSSFVLQELCEEIHEFKKDSQKSNRKKSKNVGGCLYFLMLFCFQNFPIGDIIGCPHESAMAYWTDEKVKSRVSVEKRAKKGLLVRMKPPQPHRQPPPQPHPSVSPSTSFDPDTMLTHPVVRTTYARMLSNLQQEMLALQHTLYEEGQHEGHAPNKQPSTSGPSTSGDSDDDDDDGNGHDIEEGDDVEDEDESENIIDVDDVPEHGEETPNVDAGRAGELFEHVAVPDNVKEHVQEEVTGQEIELRRSQRVVNPSSVLKSPWIDPQRKSKGKRTYDEKDTLYELCTKIVSEDEAEEEFVAMHHYFLTRRELQCLNARSWIGDRLMTMVARTLVGDQLHNGGVVQRYIFTPELMGKMISATLNWTVQSILPQIDPQKLGYNIGDCHFIFGPCLFLNHWFCYVLDTTTMTFYALDSLVDINTYYRMEYEKEHPNKQPTKKKPKQKSAQKEKEWMANKVRNRFLDILRTVKPELLEDEDKIPKDVTWAKVHLQSDTHSCGVHVISWLQSWDGSEQGVDGYTMPHFTEEELRELKVGFLWWLVTHPCNNHRQKVLLLMEDYHKKLKRH